MDNDLKIDADCLPCVNNNFNISYILTCKYYLPLLGVRLKVYYILVLLKPRFCNKSLKAENCVHIKNIKP